MKRQAGVQEFEFDINEGVGTVTFASNRAIDIEAIKAVVKETGFSLEWIDVEVTGTLVVATNAGQSDLSLRLPDREQSILLLRGEEDKTRRNHAELARWEGEPAPRFRLRGRVHSHPDGQLAMMVERFNKIE